MSGRLSLSKSAAYAYRNRGFDDGYYDRDRLAGERLAEKAGVLAAYRAGYVCGKRERERAA